LPGRILLAAGLLWAGIVVPATAGQDAQKRGKYLFDAAGCLGCHTKKGGKPLAGGRRLTTPFGDYYSPNITSHPELGIGAWTEPDLKRALRQGIAPDGSHYFPVFPYPSYTGITDTDIADLWAYLKTIPAIAQANRPHDTKPPFDVRIFMVAWKALNFEVGPFKPDPNLSQQVNRGAYLVDAIGHCGECHTPRNAVGGLQRERRLSGNPDGPEGEIVPNITPDRETGIGRWSEGDLDSLFRMGMTPDGDFVGGSMTEVVENATGRLGESDLRAMMAYLRALPPIRHKVESKKKGS
jgi:mono/diheme cytochrome c family protein